MSSEPRPTVPAAGPVVIKFPPKPATEKPLVLPRRRLRDPFEVSETTVETQKTISALRSATRNPWAEGGPVANERLVELERSLKSLAAKLEERERYLQDLEAKLGDRDRELAEMENLMKARESLLEATKNKHDGRHLTQEEMAALEKLKAEIERQEASLQEQRDALREREEFLDCSEAKLFEKVQDQQEKETELEQREEDLRTRERRLREREAQYDPAIAAALAAEKEAAKKYDEFNE